jgi:hypothetical protein
MTRLLLIGAAGLDWASFDAKTRSGELPRLAALRAGGLAGWLGGAPLTLGPAAWTTIATGVEPADHGVWRDVEAWPGGVRQTTQASWRVAPVWARLEAAGVSTGSVAWRASRPGADWPGVHIDERFPDPSAIDPADWALPRRFLPDNVRDTLRERRTHPLRITAAMLAPLVPALADIDQSRDDALPKIALGLARASTIQSAAAWMLAERQGGSPEAVFVHNPWLARMRFAFETRRDSRFAEVIPAAFRFLDGLIGRLAVLAGPDTQVLVVSPGWRGRPGVMLATGAGVVVDEAFAGAGLLDIAPTVLGRFGLSDPALPGRALAVTSPHTRAGRAPQVTPSPPAKVDPLLVFSLRKFGYRAPARPSPAWQAQGAAELALMTLDRDVAAAGQLADEALVEDPANITALRVKARACLALEDADALAELGPALARAAPGRGWGYLAQGAAHVLRGQIAMADPLLRQAELDPEPTMLLSVAAAWLAAGRPAAAERVFKAVLVLDPDNVSAEIGMAMGAGARRDFMAAEQALVRALKIDPGRPAIYLQLAQTYARTARRAEAERSAAMAMRLGAPPILADAAMAGSLPT